MSQESSSVHDVLERILKKCRRCRTLGIGTTHHDFDYRYTWFPPTISVAEIERIEAYFGVRLPVEYRVYLSEVANGGAGPTLYPLNSLLSALTWAGRLSRPFPLDGTWFRHAGAGPEQMEFCRSHLVRLGFMSEGSPTDAFIYAIPEGADSADGTIIVGESGCGLDEHLVMDGPHRGEVWHDSEGGAARRTTGFLGFVEEWLDSELDPGARRRRQAVEWDAMSETDRVRRVHHLLSSFEAMFEVLLDRRLQHYTFEEYSTEREALLDTGILDWDLRFVVGEAARAVAGSDDGAVRVGLAAFRFALGQTAMAKEEIVRSQGTPYHDAILHGRILWDLEEHDEARRVFREFVRSAEDSPQDADAPRYNDGELWYFGQLDEVERLFEASLPAASNVGTLAPRLAVAHRYLGEHETAMAIGRDDAATHCSWAAAERGANLAMQGRMAEAIDALGGAVSDHLVGLDSIAGDPVWRDVQKQPRFSELITAYCGPK